MELPSDETLKKLSDIPADGWSVQLDMTASQVKQLIRSIEVTVFIAGNQPDTMEMTAHREFLREILKIMTDALLKQKP